MSEVAIREAYRLHHLGRAMEALAVLDQAVSLAPREASLLNVRAMILDAQGRHEEALGNLQAALRIQPDFPDALNNRGIHHARERHFEQALVCYDRSLALEPAQPHARYNRATARLTVGDWLRGFRDFESRWALFPHEATRIARLKPVWLGERDVAGSTLLLHHEQGYGDTLQFCRYVLLVMRLGARVILAVPAALRNLMESLPGRPQVVAEGEPIPAHDYCCSLMSLPHVFCTTPETVPAEIPYLAADAAAARLWRDRLGEGTRLRVGLVWSGRRYPPINHSRDMPLDLLRPLLALNADFVCLQTELSVPERALLAATPNVIRYADVFEDFADTAALIENLDLILTVDTAVAHLAGALGKPVWLMNRYTSCWRWLQQRPDSPWYPTMRIFWQPSPGDWSSVVQDVLAALTGRIAQQEMTQATSVRSPESVLTLLEKSLAQHHQGRVEQAIEGYRGVLTLDPLHPDALHFLGIALAQSGRHEQALAPLALVLRLQPENATAHIHYGNALAGLLRHQEALESYEHAIQLTPSLTDAHYNRGTMLMALGRHEAAMHSYQKAIELDPRHLRAHNNLGNALYESSRYLEALHHHQQAAQGDLKFADAWTNAANTLRRLARYEEALAHSRTALEHTPDHAEAHSTHGATLAALGRHDEALQSYEQALRLKPNLAEATWNEALALLSKGALREGWTRYEARWRVKSLHLTRRYSQEPPWLGRESLGGRVILLHAEQGYGDSIQFCRYAPLVASRGARVVLGVPGALQTLMASLQGIETVVAQEPLPQFDCHCPLLSLPLALGTELATIPASIPYLHAEPVARASWNDRLGPRGAPRVGLVWSGRATHSNDSNRSIPLEQFLPLTRCDVKVVSAQKDIRPSDVQALARLPAVLKLGEELTDFADAAALLSELDLVITVDTAMAHLAGALGRPVWILLPYVADWRWLHDREESPWYPTARLFRQPAAGDWPSVIERVTAELREFRAQASGLTVLRQIVAVG